MPDTYADAEQSERLHKDSLRFAAMRELVERALQRELACRRELGPHAQLAVPRNASPNAVDGAYAKLQRRYNPDAFAEYGENAVTAAHGIIDLLTAAYRSIRRPADENEAVAEGLGRLESRPRRDETHRALESLRLAIARRIAEAEHHRDAGRYTDAIRVFESVVILDPKNQVARHALRELRELLEPPRTVVERVLGRLRWRAVK